MTSPEVEFRLRALESARAMPRLATVTAVSPLQVSVGTPDPVEVIPVGWWPTQVGQVIRIVQMGEWLLGLGPVEMPTLAQTGTIVATPAGGATTVQVAVTSGPTLALPWVSSYSPVAPDFVAISWGFEYGKGFVLGKTGTAPNGATQPIPPPGDSDGAGGTPSSGVTTVAAVDARTWRDNAWRTDRPTVLQGWYGSTDPSTGVIWYGNQWAQFAGKTIDQVELYLRRLEGGSGGAVVAKLRRHNQVNRGATLPAFTASADGPAIPPETHGWYNEPDLIPFVQTMITTGGGIAIEASTQALYAQYSGLASDPRYPNLPRDPMTFAFRVHWSS